MFALPLQQIMQQQTTACTGWEHLPRRMWRGWPLLQAAQAGVVCGSRHVWHGLVGVWLGAQVRCIGVDLVAGLDGQLGV